MARQALLERLGWTFARIRGSAFYRDADAAMQPVFARLQEIGIVPIAADHDNATAEKETSGLVMRILRQSRKNREEPIAAPMEDLEPLAQTKNDDFAATSLFPDTEEPSLWDLLHSDAETI